MNLPNLSPAVNAILVVVAGLLLMTGCEVHGFGRTCATNADCFAGEECGSAGQCLPASDTMDTGRDTESDLGPDDVGGADDGGSEDMAGPDLADTSSGDAAVDAGSDMVMVDAADMRDLGPDTRDADMKIDFGVELCPDRNLEPFDPDPDCDLVAQDCAGGDPCQLLPLDPWTTRCGPLPGNPSEFLDEGEPCSVNVQDPACTPNTKCYMGACRAYCDYATGRGCSPDQVCYEAFAEGVGVCLDACP